MPICLSARLPSRGAVRRADPPKSAVSPLGRRAHRGRPESNGHGPGRTAQARPGHAVTAGRQLFAAALCADGEPSGHGRRLAISPAPERRCGGRPWISRGFPCLKRKVGYAPLARTPPTLTAVCRRYRSALRRDEHRKEGRLRASGTKGVRQVGQPAPAPENVRTGRRLGHVRPGKRQIPTFSRPAGPPMSAVSLPRSSPPLSNRVRLTDAMLPASRHRSVNADVATGSPRNATGSP